MVFVREIFWYFIGDLLCQSIYQSQQNYRGNIYLLSQLASSIRGISGICWYSQNYFFHQYIIIFVGRVHYLQFYGISAIGHLNHSSKKISTIIICYSYGVLRLSKIIIIGLQFISKVLVGQYHLDFFIISVVHIIVLASC